MKIAWLDSSAFDAHDAGVGHPERRERLTAIRQGLARAGLAPELERVEAPPVGRERLEAVHPPAYIDAIEALCSAGGGSLDPDTRVVAASYEAALCAAGAVVAAIDGIAAGRWQRAFCSVRPPGHHALAAEAMGFCVFNNVAVGAQAALDRGLAERVAILDWDVHHGNGTQAIFYSRADVLYASWHQFPFYPGTGAADETGAGPGEGLTVNCPLASGSGDAEVLAAWRERVLPALAGFAPDLVLVSAGFDADARDPLGGLRMSARGYAELTREVVRFAEARAQGRVVSVLEGGYDLEALALDVAAHVGAL